MGGKPSRPFLTAHWSHLLNVTYQVPPEILLPMVPPEIELDVQDGYAFASVVAFDFLETRVRGITIPFHVNFPEINLRFYIKHNGRRGVMFWKELVPRYCIALVARRIYNEPYEATRMKSEITGSGESRRLVHEFRYGGKSHRITADFGSTLTIPEEGSVAHYFKEHELGVGVDHQGKTLQYEVKHPVWEVFDLKDYQLDMDFGAVYGEQWDFLKEAKPYTALLAKGSAIEVYPAGELDR